jgi:hypothetical protein
VSPATWCHAVASMAACRRCPISPRSGPIIGRPTAEGVTAPLAALISSTATSVGNDPGESGSPRFGRAVGAVSISEPQGLQPACFRFGCRALGSRLVCLHGRTDCRRAGLSVSGALPGWRSLLVRAHCWLALTAGSCSLLVGVHGRLGSRWFGVHAERALGPLAPGRKTLTAVGADGWLALTATSSR